MFGVDIYEFIIRRLLEFEDSPCNNEAPDDITYVSLGFCVLMYGQIHYRRLRLLLTALLMLVLMLVLVAAMTSIND